MPHPNHHPRTRSSTFATWPEFDHFALLPPWLPQPLSCLTQICKGLLTDLPIYTHVHPHSSPQRASEVVLWNLIPMLSFLSSDLCKVSVLFRVNSHPDQPYEVLQDIALGSHPFSFSSSLFSLACLLGFPQSHLAAIPLRACAFAAPSFWKVILSNLSPSKLPYQKDFPNHLNKIIICFPDQ